MSAEHPRTIETPIQRIERNMGRSKAMSLDELAAFYQKHLEKVDADLKLIGESLRDIANRIKTEKPDDLVFLDRGARVFGTPFVRYLFEEMGKGMPEVSFYNDSFLKDAYLNKGSVDEVVEEELDGLKGKKVFFIDETYSRGKGAAALDAARKVLGADMQYFALSLDPSNPPFLKYAGDFPLSEEQHTKNIDRLMEDKSFATVYDNAEADIFSRYTARFYVQEVEGVTAGQRPPKSEEAKAKQLVPSANDYMEPPEGMTMEEYDAKAHQLTFDTVKQVKQKIYETLRAQDAA